MTIQPNHIINLAKQQTRQWHIYCIYKHIYDHFAEKQDITHICYLQGGKKHNLCSCLSRSNHLSFHHCRKQCEDYVSKALACLFESCLFGPTVARTRFRSHFISGGGINSLALCITDTEIIGPSSSSYCREQVSSHE